MRIILVTVSLFLLITLVACASVDVTKTAKGHHEPTDPNQIEILMTKPTRAFLELATVSTAGWNPNETAKMHNALRAKCAPLGAHAVILPNSGVVRGGGLFAGSQLWSTGVAIRYKGR